MSSTTKNKAVFRFPFDINPNYFLIGALVCFVLSFKNIGFNSPSIGKEKVVKELNEYIAHNNKQIEAFISNTNNLKRFLQKDLTKSQLDALQMLPYKFFVYENDKLLFWNNTVINPLRDSLHCKEIFGARTQSGFYIVYNKKFDSNKVIQLFLPVKYEYGYRNNFLVKRFLAFSEKDKVDFSLSLTPISNAEKISFEKKTIFYLYKGVSDLNQYNASFWEMFKAFFFFIFFGICMHTYFKVIIKQYSAYKTFIYLILTAVVVRSLSFFYNFPNDFSEFVLFDSSIYNGGFFGKSLGDSFINACLCFWVLEFYFVNVQDFTSNHFRKKYKIFLLIFIFLTIPFFAHLTIKLIGSIILDSNINFDVSFFDSIQITTIFGLGTCLVIFCCFCFILLIYNRHFEIIKIKKKNKYIGAILGILVYCLLLKNVINTTHVLLFLWVVLFFLFLDSQKKVIKFDFGSYRLFGWFIIFSFSSSIIISYFIYQKNEQTQYAFLNSLAENRDAELEKKLLELSGAIKKDSFLISKFKEPGINTRNIIYTYINNKYLIKIKENYGYVLNLYNTHSACIPLKDTFFLGENENSFLSSMCINNTDTSVKINYNPSEVVWYNVYIPLSLGATDTGKIFLRVSKNDYYSKDHYLNIYKSITNDESFKMATFSYGIYQHGVLRLERGVYKFPKNISDFNNTLKNVITNKTVRKTNRANDIVVYNNSDIFFVITSIFALLFTIIFVFISLYILGNIIARSNLNYFRFLKLLNVNLRFRIHATIIVIELASFFIIYLVVSNYFIKKTNSNLEVQLLSNNEIIVNKVNETISESNFVKDSITNAKKSTINNALVQMGNNLNAVIRLLDKDGEMLYSSQSTLFAKSIINDYLSPSYYFSTPYIEKNFSVFKEKIGRYEYLTTYTPLYNKQNIIIGYVQSYYFDALNKSKGEIFSILITLINIFILIFALSSIVAYYITSRVTDSFSKVVKQFTRINLNKINELIEWPYSDEIGVLVMEYNRMLRKLETSTQTLARNERDNAWREMAKQVAHEIKNPLTPMKLSLQMLQNAIKNKKDNVLEITANVTETLIEQINVLNVIATNFSNFAKLPDLKLEDKNVTTLLRSFIGIYYDSEHCEYFFIIPEEPIYVTIDTVQFQRVVTNLLQNAVQALPPNKTGSITLEVKKVKNASVLIEISDNGKGISEAIKKNIFQPYFTTKSSGTGLGLAMCKDLIENMSGKIWFESVENEGTIFFIELPLIQNIEEEL